MKKQEYTPIEDLKPMLNDEKYVKEYVNYITFDGMDKKDAFCETFNVDNNMTQVMRNRMNRWVKREDVQKWLSKANRSLETDWIDKRVNAMNHLYNLGTNPESTDRIKIDALDKFLAHLNREESRIRLDIGENTQVNIVNVIQNKLNALTREATINPAGAITYKGHHEYTADEAIIIDVNDYDYEEDIDEYDQAD